MSAKERTGISKEGSSRIPKLPAKEGHSGEMSRDKRHKMAAEEKDRDGDKIPMTINAKEKQLMATIKKKDGVISELMEIKPERDKLLKKLEKAEGDLSKSTNTVNKYKNDIDVLKELNKKIHLEKDHMQHQKETLAGQNRHAEAEIETLSEQNTKLTTELKQSRQEQEVFKGECKSLRDELAKAAITEKHLAKLEQRHAKLNEKYEECEHKLELGNNTLNDERKHNKNLEKENEEKNLANRNLRIERDKIQTQMRVLELAKDQIKLKLEQSENSNFRLQNKVKRMNHLKQMLLDKDAEKMALTKTHNEDLMNRETLLQEAEERCKEEIEKREKLDMENFLQLENLRKAKEKLSEAKKTIEDLVERKKEIKKELKAVKKELDTALSAKQTLEVQLRKSKEKEETGRLNFKTYRDKAEQEKLDLSNHIAYLQDVIQNNQKEFQSLENKINLLLKQNDDLMHALSNAQSESLESQKQVQLVKYELSDTERQHFLSLKKINREFGAYRGPRRCTKKRRGSYLWSSAMLEMVQEAKHRQVTKRPGKILHEPCAGRIKKLEKEKDQLQNMLNRRPEDATLQLYWTKKDLQKAKDDRKVSEANYSLYYNMYLQEKEEKLQLMQEARELKSFVRNCSVQASQSKPTDSYRRPVFDLHGQCIINTNVAIINMPSETVKTSPRTRIRNLPPISTTTNQPQLLPRITPLPPINHPKPE